MTSNVLKYYKLLVTLPSLKVTLIFFILSLIPIISHKPYILLAEALIVLLLYEHKALNVRRLLFLLTLSNVAYVFNLDALAVLIIGVSSTLLAPSALTPFIITLPLWIFEPKTLLPLLPLVIFFTISERVGMVSFGAYWLRSWMSDDYYPLERFIQTFGKETKATMIRVGKLLFTDVHFGLMRFSMSSIMPHLLALRGPVPHRLCGSHERNVASRWEMYKMLKDADPKGSLLNSIKIRIWENDKVRVFEVADIKIVEHKGGADDLPCLNDVKVADPHNCEGERPSAHELRENIEKLKLVEERLCSEMEVCEVEVRGKGLCWKRAYLVKFVCNKPFKHLILFSNNMKKCYREEMKEKYGLEAISTVDDHTRSGIGRSTYEPASEVEIVSVRRCTKAPLEYGTKEVSYVSMGDLIFSEGSMASMEKYIKFGLLVSALSIIIALLL